jgi:hypothetical protein
VIEDVVDNCLSVKHLPSPLTPLPQERGTLQFQR